MASLLSLISLQALGVGGGGGAFAKFDLVLHIKKLELVHE